MCAGIFVNTLSQNPEKLNLYIIPAVACLMLLTVGTLSVYGSMDLILPMVISFSIVGVFYLAMIVAREKLPN